MIKWKRCAKINLKVLIILLIVTVALGASLFTARQIRRSFLSKAALRAGQEAYENEDWQAAYRNFREYLGRNPDDIEILKKYATAGLSIRPLNDNIINRVIAAYRQVMRLDPQEEIAYDKLAMLYTGTGNYEELAYIARTKIDDDPNNPKAHLWLGEALKELNKTTEAKKELNNEIITKLKPLLPLKYPEYVRACVLMSQIILDEKAYDAEDNARDMLNAAVDYDPNSLEALASRARFNRQLAFDPGKKDNERKDYLNLAKQDLNKADTIGTENPLILFIMAEEWIACREPDRAADELKKLENLSPEIIQKYFLDLNLWTVAKFQLAAKLAIQKRDIDEGISRANETLNALDDKKYRAQVLPYAIEIFVNADDQESKSKARAYLDEFTDILYTNVGQTEFGQYLVYLRAIVAKAENNPYEVIDILQPAVVSDDTRPELWGLLAEAFIQTDQPRRAINALLKYLRLRPGDTQMTLLLAKEYLKLQNWSKAFQAAQLAETMDPADIILALLRIEASINIAVSQITFDEARLLKLEGELAELRTEHTDRIDIRILQAIIAEYLKRPQEAENELKKAIEECSETLSAEIQLVRFYYRAKRSSDAVSTCLKACERHPQVAEPWVCLSSLYEIDKDYESARSCLEKAQQVVVGKWEQRLIAINLGRLEVLYGNLSLGINHLRDITEEDKKEIFARSLLLNISEIRQDKTTAQQLIEELKAAESNSGLMWRRYQAEIWLESDDWRAKQQDIKNYLQYCIDSDPEWSAPPLLLAKLYEKMNDLERLEQTYQQALIRNPSATEIADRLVTFLAEQGRYTDAENILRQTGADTWKASALNIRAAISTGDFTRAINELKVRISNNKQDADSRILLARLIYWQDRDEDQALRYLDEAEAIEPGTLALTSARVAILKAEGKNEEAWKILNEYVENNDQFEAYMVRASYLDNVGDFERAEQDYKKLTTFSKRATIGYELLSDFYRRNEKYDKAVEVIEDGLNQYPDDLRLKRRLMNTLFLQSPAQNREKANKILSELEQRLRQDPELMLIRAQQILNESQILDESPQSLDVVKEKLENVIKLEPTATYAHLLLINILMDKKEYEAARDHAIRGIGSNPNNMSLLLARSWAEIELKNIPMSVQLANAVLQNDPNNAQARDMISLAALRSNNNIILKQAQTLIQSMSDDNPIDEKMLLSEISGLASKDIPELAIAIPLLETYCKTEKGSDSIDAIVTLADLYRISGEMDKAKELIEQAANTDTNNQTVVHARFLWLIAQKRFEELSDISSAYISAKKQNPKILMKAATILLTLDSNVLKKEGLKLYKHIEAMPRELRNEQLNFASTLYQTGNAEEAKNIYQELLTQDPNNIRILNDLAWIIQEHDHSYDDALKLANKALDLAPDNLNLLDTRGTILSNLPDRFVEAKYDFERLVQLSTFDNRQHAKALLMLGRICVKLNQFDQAKQHFNNALEVNKKIGVDIFTPEELSEIKKVIQKTN